MARKHRVEFAALCYHVIARGNQRENTLFAGSERSGLVAHRDLLRFGS
jgi:hypothetical protein